jgi:predicted DNA-binding transcriptional regulator AlpA
MEISLLNRKEVCFFFGGNRPLDASTLYRGIKAGRFPRPVRVGGLSRWLRTECEATLQAMVEGRAGR